MLFTENRDYTNRERECLSPSDRVTSTIYDRRSD